MNNILFKLISLMYKEQENEYERLKLVIDVLDLLLNMF